MYCHHNPPALISPSKKYDEAALCNVELGLGTFLLREAPFYLPETERWISKEGDHGISNRERKYCMTDFIVKYWVQELFALVIAGGTWIWRTAGARRRENMIIREGMLALLHDRLFKACSFYIEQGWCPVEGRHNLECLFKPYSDLGGDGTAESLYHKCMDLPISLEEKNSSEGGKRKKEEK